MKLCLNAIVKNEAGRIERMLKSVIDHIDCAVIHDTGSTDNTKEVIQRVFIAHKKPLEILDEPFVDWSQARNAALGSAYTSKFDFDHVLLVDADMELVVKDPNWKKLDPSVNVWMVTQFAGPLAYANARLVRRDAKTRYVGVTHEYLEGDPVGVIEPGTMHFLDHADGSNRPEKHNRDIRLLEEALKDETLSYGLRGRYLYYLGQSFRESGQHEKAKQAYETLIKLGGWDEEQFFARYFLAYCRRSLGDDSGFVVGLLDAYNFRPHRAEPLYDLATHFRVGGKNGLGFLFAEGASSIPMTNDLLFVNRPAYTYGPREEMSICGFYLPHRKHDGYNAANHLSLDPTIPPATREQARRNLGHYLQPLHEVVPSVVHHRINISLDTNWEALNPSIAVVGMQMKCIVRTVNYLINEAGQYVIGSGAPYSAENPIDTRNFLVDIDSIAYTASNVREVVWPGRDKLPAFPFVRGLEDMRLFEHRGQLYASTTVREANPEGFAEQCLVRLAPAGAVYMAEDFHRMIPKHGRFPAEKNWMPFRGPEIQFIYRAGQVINADGIMVHSYPSSIDVNALAGGSQAVYVAPDKYLAIVHEARQDDHDYGKRWYWHRFLMLDATGRATAVSRPFIFHKKQIEFCAGLCVHPNGKQLVISYGVRDREAWLAVVDIDSVIGGLLGNR